jgi:quinol monooxygenase YgiN
MSIKVVATRRFKKDRISDAYRIVMEIRSMAVLQHGHISSETLISEDDPGKVVFVSNWQTRKDWEAWYKDPRRAALMKRMEDCLVSPELVEVFHIGEKAPEWVHMA